ncbi:MAG: hypothetical protein SGPRY_014743, partial [Prymnesium sp.]
TTRDAIDESVVNHGRKYTFVDTAGIRRTSKVSKGVEELMVRRALKAARRADLCLLVVDAAEGASDQVWGGYLPRREAGKEGSWVMGSESEGHEGINVEGWKKGRTN